MSNRSYTQEEGNFLLALEEEYDNQDGTHVPFTKEDAEDFAVEQGKLDLYNALVARGDIEFMSDGEICTIRTPGE